MNTPFFTLKLSELPEDKVHVHSFEAREGLSGLYEYRIHLLSEDAELDPSKILNRNAAFSFTRQDQSPVLVNGIISHFEQRGRSPDYVSYYAVLVPRLWRLLLNHQNAIYQNMDIEEIAKRILGNSGLSGQDYQFNLNSSYPKLEFAMQFRETDFAFLNRRLEHHGIFYYFDHASGSDIIVLADSNEGLKLAESQAVPYNPNRDPLCDADTIFEFSGQASIVTGSVKLKGYNYLHPERQLVSESGVLPEMPGNYYEYGGNFSEAGEADFLTRMRNEEIACHSRIFQGNSDCRAFHAGTRFRIEKHYRADWNSEYIVLSTVMKGHQSGIFGILQAGGPVRPTFENRFEAIPASIPFRPARKTPVPQFPGIMTGKIESATGDQYASIDEYGRYRMKFRFDQENWPAGQASAPIRMAQPLSGADYGIHFPNHADTEIVWSCINGDPDRPMGLGTVPNPLNQSPVVNSNRSQSVIRTANKNEIVMEDQIDNARISITTSENNKAVLDDKEDRILLETTQAHQVCLDDKNKKILVQSKNGHAITIDDENSKININSANGHFIQVNDVSGEESITVSDKAGENLILIDIANSKLVIKTENGDIDLHAPNGTIDIKATTLNIETSGDTKLAAASVTAEAQGDVKMSGNNITAEANMDLKQSAMNITSEASMDNKIKGLNVTSEAQVNHDTKGTMINSKASAMNVVKGTPVMIN